MLLICILYTLLSFYNIEFFMNTYGSLQIRTVAAKYIMKCDDDTFVRVDSVISKARQIQSGKSFYMGYINNHPKPMHSGKWAVNYEV
jgi:hypothetical protein